MKKTIVFFLLISSAFTMLTAQEALKSVAEEYYDSLSLQGIVIRPTLGYRTLSDSVWFVDENAEHPWKNNNLGTLRTIYEAAEPGSSTFLDGINQSVTLRIYGPEWFNSYNSSIPYGQNDGALWQGVGYNTSLTAGVRLEGFGFEATFKPQIVWSQNKDYDHLPGINGYDGSYYDRIDIVQRYGDSAYYDFSWGDSEIRYTWKTLTMGFGTQSPWLGPAWLNPMLGSNNATPYPKFDIGLRKIPVVIPWIDWYAGDIEARMFVGRLKQSEYFNSPTKPDDRMLVEGSFSISPSFINGLSVGFNRAFVTYWDYKNLIYLGRLLYISHNNGTGSGNDEDQKLAIYADWTFPEAGFEVYGEYGFDDFSYYKIPDIFHTGIYTIGMKQIIPHSSNVYGVLNAEWNNAEISSDFYFQWQYLGYYAHSFVSQGYTSNGQILGAGTGFMGNSQKLSYTLYYPKGYSAVSLHRYCNNNNHTLNNAVFDDYHKQTGFTADEVAAIKSKYAKYETVLSFGADTAYFLNDSLSVSFGADVYKVFMNKYDPENNFWTASAKCSIKYVF